MKKLLTFIFIAFSLVVYGQETSITTYKHNINLGVGSSMWGMLTNSVVKGSLVNKAYATPVFHAAYGYEVYDRVFFGVGASYQYFHFDLLPIDNSHSALVTNINRLNLNLHTEFMVVRQKSFNAFVGGQLGVTFWSGKLTFTELRDYVQQLIPYSFISDKIIETFVPSDQKFFYTGYSKQIYLGVNKYMSSNLGLHAELALGSPYWCELGLTYRFGKK